MSGDPGASSDTWLRKWQLILGSSTGSESKILSQDKPDFDLKIKFEVHQASVQTPNYAVIEVYNLSDTTAYKGVKEFDQVTLEVGYQTGRFGTIFSGTVKMYERGHESAVDSYLRIFAADGDKPLNFATINEVVNAGTTAEQKQQKLSNAFAKEGAKKGYVDPKALVITPNIRDNVLFGMAADEMRLFGQQNGAVWSIYSGDTSYDPGAIVVLNGRTGLIGWRTATLDGIIVVSLINPAIRLRQRIQLDNKTINQFNVPGGGPAFGVQFPGFGEPISYAQTSTDGIYAPLVIEYRGDSRANEWYQTMVCLAVDPTLDATRALKEGTKTSLPAEVTTQSIVEKGGT